jgi:hypothetical protein
MIFHFDTFFTKKIIFLIVPEHLSLTAKKAALLSFLSRAQRLHLQTKASGASVLYQTM